jgi:hypothetical protein
VGLQRQAGDAKVSWSDPGCQAHHLPYMSRVFSLKFLGANLSSSSSFSSVIVIG